MAILHTDIPTRTQVDALLTARAPESVSLYLPTNPASTGEAERIGLQNLTSQALEQLREAGADKDDVAELAEHLADLVEDDEFFRYQARSLAVFATPASINTFRLPNHLREVVEVSDRFHLKPLLRSITFPQTALVLALAQNSVRLLEIVPDMDPVNIDVPGMPKDVDSAVGRAFPADRSPMRRLQAAEGKKVRIRQFARQVDRALRPVLRGDVPLILAATEPLQSIFRSVSGAPELARVGLTGNPEESTDRELGSAARDVLDDLHVDRLRDLHRLFEQRTGQGRTVTDIADVARQATMGAVDTVFVDIDHTVPGFIDEVGAVRFEGTDDAVAYGVVDEIARRVWLTGGQVLAVRQQDIPGGGGTAAILRYAP
ncbi:baeRF11 domain-containing protein [Saccharopolyspora sp. 5N708]|uniref:baeRF11 domain-containing protein n=1 Tax=Saccharopolyspora sp. 5N708 TaxID=3457424 RepID=UPI003FD38CD8